MNEELKIIIKAVADPAKKSIGEVKKQLQDLEGTGKKSGAAISTALKGFAKGAAIAVAAITGLTAAMAKLGQSSQEVNKGLSKLESSFKNAGSSAKEATKYYKELFGVIGDHDRTVETGQSLARITTDPAALSEYKDIMAGAISQYGDGYNTEALAENISETVASGKLIGDLERALVEAGISADGFNAALERIASTEERELMLRQVLNGIFGNAGKIYQDLNQATIEYNDSQSNLNVAMAKASSYTTPLRTALNTLSTTFLTALAPALRTVAIYLTSFIELIAEAIKWVGNFFGVMGSSAEESAADWDGYSKAMDDYSEALRKSFSSTNNGVKDTIKSVKELKRQTMGFDELNIVSSQTSASVGGISGGGGADIKVPTAPNPKDFGLDAKSLGFDLEGFKADVEEATEKLKILLGIAAGVGGAIGLWKLGSFVYDLVDTIKNVKSIGKIGKEAIEEAMDAGRLTEAQAESYKSLEKMKAMLKNIAAYALIIGGAILAIWGYCDAWINGLNWGNFAAVVGGIAAVVGGLTLKFGKLGGAIGLIVGGVAMVVLGIKDLIENGASLQNILMIVIGSLAALAGVLILVGLENIKAAASWLAHTAALIGHKVATIAATVAEKAMAVAQAALNLVMSLSPLTWIVLAIAAVVAALVILWVKCEGFREVVKQVFDAIVGWIKSAIDWIVNAFKAVINFFKDNWQALLLMLVNPFAGAFKLLYDNCDGFREFIDKWVEKIAQFFKDLWTKIKAAFAGVGKWFSDVFSGAWNGIRNAFSAVGNFFKGIWNTIKSIFSNVGSTIGNAITNTVKKAINAVLSGAVKIINGFISAINLAIDIINAIPGVNIKTLNKLSVPQLAKGGIVNSATLAVIGERGKEAVMPLENNTGWMDTLADRIASRNQSPSKIVLALDGKELGWANINSINNITKQTGELQLVLG